jgi:hypothetical protein
MIAHRKTHSEYFSNAILSARIAESQPGWLFPREAIAHEMKAMTLRTGKVVAALVLLAGCAWSQDATPNDQQTIAVLAQQIKDLQKQAAELQARLQALEAAHDAAPIAVNNTQSAPAGSGREASQPETVLQTASTEPSPGIIASLHDFQRIQWRGFGEADYKVLDQRQPETGTYGFVPGSAGNFYTGDFGLFLTGKISEKANVLSEIIFEEDDAQSFKVDLRRMLLNYDYNDHMEMSFGRYQIGIGYYNWAFRSAAWLQTTADRPLVMEYSDDGGPLPTQAVGVSLTGTIPSGRLGLNYIAQYGSSDTIRPDINGDGLENDENNGNHINIGLFAVPDRVPGLRIGASLYRDQISDLVFVPGTGGESSPPSAKFLAGESPSPSDRWNQTIVNAHVIYVAHGFESLNEGFLVRHALIGADLPFDTPAFYSQLAKKLGPIQPFVRYQYMNASPRNLIYHDIGLRYGPSFGARYDFNDYIAFKAQLDHTVRRGLPDLNGLHLQMAFTF